MATQDEIKRAFRRLKINSVLDLALILPVSYDDFRLSDAIVPGRMHTLEAVVQKQGSAGGRMTVEFFLPRFGRTLTAIFFKTTSYHYKLFETGSRHYIHGKVTLYRGRPQMAQPRSLKECGTITPRYKSVLKESELREIVSFYIKRDNLLAEGLRSAEAEFLVSLHFPSEASIDIAEILQDAKSVKVLKSIEAYNHLAKLRTKRHDYPALGSLNGDTESFIASLPFALTDDQLRAIGDIKADLARSDKAARRVIIGDVGSGKTMVILAAAAIAGKKKSLLMAPTSILAIQLYEEALKYLPEGIKTALVTQSKTEGECHSADFVIGTHALLYRDDLPRAALVMVDEQHRFGTRQRSMLEALVSEGERRPHYLQFSATPIPRTQAMMESSLVDVTLIEQTPFKKNIDSIVIGKSGFRDLMRHIERELGEGHQVLIVYPLVEESTEIPYQSIDEARAFWEERFDGVYVTHGRDKNKELILESFRDKGRILLATTVIEVGISLPLLTTVVIVGAERLGLATLHQLRGRAGRSGLKSRCYLYSNDPDNERLKRFCSVVNGFEIARLDLAYRNSGDIVDGTIQSGQKFKWLDMAEDEEIIAEASRRLESR